MKWTLELPARSAKLVERAIGKLSTLRNSHIERNGVHGAESSDFTLYSPFGPPSNPEACKLWEELGARHGWKVDDVNLTPFLADLASQVEAAAAALPVVDKRRTLDEETERARQCAERDAVHAAQSAAADASRAAILAKAPKGAAALIVAELEEDRCEPMTDYFATATTRIVAIGWRLSAREDFRALRRAAATFPETAHLADAPDTAEHRDNWSMGAGNYLKSTSRYSNGWKVRSLPMRGGSFQHCCATVEDALPAVDAPAPSAGGLDFGAFSLLQSRNKRGPFSLVVLSQRVERDAFERLRSSAQDSGGWYSRQWGSAPGGFGFADVESARAWAESALAK